MQHETERRVKQDRSGKLPAIGIFFVGLGLTATFYAVITLPNFRGTTTYRYCCGHPIEVWTTWLFFWGMTALVWKALRLAGEAGVLNRTVLELQPGRPVSVAEIPRLLAALGQLRRGVLGTWFVRRITDALGYVLNRGSTEGLEERLEILADRDANDLEGSYELVRTVAWAIPILGFLGTVIGITIAIANITPDQLQDSLDDVVGGLAVAFDTTALALALSMMIVLTKFFVERAERAVLSRVDRATDELLLHRFEKHPADTQAFVGVVDGVARVVLQATRDAWREQGQLWSRTVEQLGDAQITALQNSTQRLVDQAAQMIGKQEAQFQQFLTALEGLRQVTHKSMTDVATKMVAHQAAVKRQVELLGQVVADEGRVSKLQQSLNSNLASLANAQSLDEAIHSLTAAVHLLTARAGRDARPGTDPQTRVAA